MNPDIFRKWWNFLMRVKTEKAQKFLKPQIMIFITLIGTIILLRLMQIEPITIYKSIKTSHIINSLV